MFWKKKKKNVLQFLELRSGGSGWQAPLRGRRATAPSAKHSTTGARRLEREGKEEGER